MKFLAFLVFLVAMILTSVASVVFFVLVISGSYALTGEIWLGAIVLLAVIVGLAWILFRHNFGESSEKADVPERRRT